MPHTYTRCCVLSLLLLAYAARVQATPPFELLGAVTSSGGYSARTTGASAASAYFNPALLPNARPGVELGVFVLQDSIDIALAPRSPAFDIPEAALNQFQGEMPSLPTSWLQAGCAPDMGGRCVTALAARPRQGGANGGTHVYQVFGIVATVVERYLVLGLYGMVPTGSLLRGKTFYADEREQYFSNNLHAELYEDRLGALSLAFGAGSRLTDWLSIGIGTTLGMKNSVVAGTFIGNSNRIAQTLVLSTDLVASLSFAPHLGVQLQPTPWLSFSMTVHAPQQQAMTAGISNFLPNGDLQVASRSVVLAWTPWTFALGTQLDFLRLAQHRMSAVAGAAYALWSDYVDRTAERPRAGYLWSDTLQVNAGVRHMYREQLSSFVDVQYAPTPVPLQTGRSNYVDNDRIGFSAGTSYELPISGTSMRLRFGVQAQLQLLLQRWQTKIDPLAPPYAGQRYPSLVADEWVDNAVNNRGEPIAAASGLQTNNPGWPGFGSSGLLWGAGANAAVLF